RIIEKDRVGHGASHGNCGLLYFSDIIPLCSPGTVGHEMVRALCGTSPLYIKPALDPGLLIWLLKFAAKCRPHTMQRIAAEKSTILRYSIDLFEQLLALEDLDCDFEKKGLLTVCNDPKNLDSLKKKNALLEPYGMSYKLLERDRILEMEPALKPGIAGGWYSEIDWHLRPDLLMASWRKHLTKKGLIIEEHAGMLDFEIHGNTITKVNTIRGKFAADAFVMATGAWASRTAKQLGLDLPVQPGKGYSITMERPGICPQMPCVLYEKSMVVTPWESGYRLGGTMEFSGFSTTLNPKRLAKLVNGAGQYMKDPTGHPVIEEWTGLRPMTYDDMPIIDRSASQENLIIATGHGMLGLTLATGTGKIVTDMVFDKTPDIDITPFAISRFR
ncbi:MAG: FAD-dependent oxidoreductase, partial [Proteobacteria bacterium]|nr:FAD-dependent oxidoreductase [Pseudomonadota bacterium]